MAGPGEPRGRRRADRGAALLGAPVRHTRGGVRAQHAPCVGGLPSDVVRPGPGPRRRRTPWPRPSATSYALAQALGQEHYALCPDVFHEYPEADWDAYPSELVHRGDWRFWWD
ncbi:DUF4253 domain-containing protein [Streptomyces wuyuanensis]|uniref:DUF4253 domain-containing protein n=1 Tax=Streptomyces wuyuanensis TaxID=1196353 RepID=UPI0038149D67